MPTVGLVILAAGSSTRLGSPKQLLSYEGKSLLRRAAETAVASPCRPIVVVLGDWAPLCRERVEGLPVTTVDNHNWKDGIGSSLRLGLETLLQESGETPDAALILLCDQPLLTVSTLEALLDEFDTTSCRIVASEYAGTVGVPALFHRSLFPELLALSGDQGAKKILARYPDEIRTIPFPEGALDIDTAADYQQLKQARP